MGWSRGGREVRMEKGGEGGSSSLLEEEREAG